MAPKLEKPKKLGQLELVPSNNSIFSLCEIWQIKVHYEGLYVDILVLFKLKSQPNIKRMV